VESIPSPQNELQKQSRFFNSASHDTAVARSELHLAAASLRSSHTLQKGEICAILLTGKALSLT